MAGGVLEELQRSCWGIWCGHHSNGCCLSILSNVKMFYHVEVLSFVLTL